MKNVEILLTRAWEAYANGEPFLTDAEFDALASRYGFNDFQEGVLSKKAKHAFPMYSLKKIFDEEPSPLPPGQTVESPKLDGAAISLLYEDRQLVRGITRGNGFEGEDITEKCYLINTIPNIIAEKTQVQITGEVVCSKKLENSRNFASGALHVKDLKEFKDKKADKLTFVAYDMQPYIVPTYWNTLDSLEAMGFIPITDKLAVEFFPTDGTVIRLNSNIQYIELGHTAKHPRGSYARKLSSDVATEETTLLDVKWQVGRTGQVTPVAIFEEIIIDGAKINRATLHNVGFINEHEFEIGDTILVTRSGGIIPKVLGKL